MALVDCRGDGTHQYPDHLRSCPYCTTRAPAPPPARTPVQTQVPASAVSGGKPATSLQSPALLTNLQLPAPKRSSGLLKWVIGLGTAALVGVFGFTSISGGGRAGGSTEAGEPAAVMACNLSMASISASQTAPEGVDSEGRSVGYPASNLVDGDEATAWRAPGEAVGETISFSLSNPCTVSAIEILNGYHKVDQADGTDRWEQNRRIKKLEVYLDDLRLAATLDTNSRGWQRIDASGAAVTSITIKIVSSSPSKPERDFTALSEVRVTR